MTADNLTKKITFHRQVSNSLLTDKPIYETLFSTYANIVWGSNGGFNSLRGSDIIKVSATVQIRNTANVKNLSLHNLFVSYNNRFYKVTTDLYESEQYKGYLKFNTESIE